MRIRHLWCARRYMINNKFLDQTWNSLGSTIQSQSFDFSRRASRAAAEASFPGGTSSSPRKSWEGKVATTVSLIVFSQRGSINVNRSLLFALVLVTSVGPELPVMISPAFLEASMATSRMASRTALEGISVDDIDTIVAERGKFWG